jgi:hypothetical protein
MRDLTTTETEQCSGGGPPNNGFAKPDAIDPPRPPIDLTVDTSSNLPR